MLESKWILLIMLESKWILICICKIKNQLCFISTLMGKLRMTLNHKMITHDSSHLSISIYKKLLQAWCALNYTGTTVHSWTNLLHENVIRLSNSSFLLQIIQLNEINANLNRYLNIMSS